MSSYRFPLRKFDGTAFRYYLADSEDLAGAQQQDVGQTSHHILIVDCSGSMYGDIRDVRETIQKVLTLEEFQNADQLVSLISYASMGDVKIHFSRIKVDAVMAPGSPYLDQIRKLNTRGCTCISQSLAIAQSLCRAGELTCISLHSDGWANDRSSASENVELDKQIKQYSQMSDVFVNTLAYRQYVDFNLLSKVANSLSGKCLKVAGIKEVYQALHDTTSLLASSRFPAIVRSLDGAGYQVFVSKGDRKTNGTGGELVIRGLSAESDKTLYRYREVDAATYEASKAPVCGEGGDLAPLLAFVRAQLSEGNINQAKYALVSTRDETLLATHYRALTNEALALMAVDVDAALYDGTGTHSFSAGYGLDTSKASVLEILRALEHWTGKVQVDVKHLQAGYHHRSLQRLDGSRQDDGTVALPWITTRYTDKPETGPEGEERWCTLTDLVFNRANATINLQVRRPIELVERATGNAIHEVANVDLRNLATFRNYTAIGDGALNIKELKLRFDDKRAFRDLQKLGVVEGEYHPHTAYKIDLDSRPVTPFNQTFKGLDGVFEKTAGSKVLVSILKALTEGESVQFTGEQVEELKRHYVTPSLYVSLPSTTPYTDLQDALAKGQVDSRTSFNVDIGNTKIISLSQLKSANAYLERRFTLTANGEDQKKPKLQMWWAKDWKVGVKALSARTKLDAVDELMYPIFEDFLGTKRNGSVEKILRLADITEEQLARFEQARSRALSREESVEVFKEIQRLLKDADDKLFHEVISPVVFYIGSTGLTPDEWNAKALNAEALSQKFPDIKIGKDESEGSFYLLGNTIVSVYGETVHFTPDHAWVRQ